MRLGLATTLLVALAVALPALPSSAHDSLSPPGAAHHWLPNEEWSHKHWVPYDESTLYSILGIDTPVLFKWLTDDHHTIAQLAQRRGVDPRTLAKRLMAPRRADLSQTQYRVLRERAERTLTQGHLAQHVFFHVFHGSHLNGHEDGHIEEIFGVDRPTYNRLRQKGLSPLKIARRHGRDADMVREHVIEAVRHESEMGTETGAMTPAQADRMLARQMRVVDCWLTSPLAKLDPDNPFGDTYGWHGPHKRSTRNGIKHPKTPAGCWKPLPEA
jgi:hypothetical protein